MTKGQIGAKRLVILARKALLPVLHRIRPSRFSDAPPYRVLTIPTDAVTRMQQRWDGPIQLPWLQGSRWADLAPLRRRWHAGIVLDGDWDRATLSFADYHLTRVLEARFAEGAEWEEIPYVRKAFRKVRAGESAWGGRCRTAADVRARCRYLDALHTRLASEGYSTSRSAHVRGRAFTHFLVNIGRDGTIIRNNDGKHRIILSRILGIPRLQARVLVRHREWQRIRIAVRQGDPLLTARFGDHPDLVGL